MRASSTSSRTRWSKDSSCQKACPVRPRIRLACRAVEPFNHRIITGRETRYSGIAQPNRPESSFIHFTVRDEKSSARGWSCARRRMQQPGSWDGAGQTPGDKQEGCLREIGMPVGKLSAIEHNELAGESACPTYSACMREKSQENVETPGAG